MSWSFFPLLLGLKVYKTKEGWVGSRRGVNSTVSTLELDGGRAGRARWHEGKGRRRSSHGPLLLRWPKKQGSGGLLDRQSHQSA